MGEKRIRRKAFIVFFLLVVSFSAILEVLYCSGGPEWTVALLMWIPALSAFAAAAVSLRENSESFSFIKLFRLTGIKRCRFRYLLLGIAIPFLYLFIPYRIYWTMHPENFAYSGVSFLIVMKDLLLYTVVYVFLSLLTAAGEEIGWRGFMLPALLERIGEKKAITAVSLFWCLWHLPLLIWGGYMEGTPLWYQLIAFLFCIFPIGVIAALLTIRSGSVWPAAFLHAAHNAFDQAVFGVITRGDDRMYYVSETGLLTILCAWITAVIIYVLYKRNQKPHENKPAR